MMLKELRTLRNAFKSKKAKKGTKGKKAQKAQKKKEDHLMYKLSDSKPSKATGIKEKLLSAKNKAEYKKELGKLHELILKQEEEFKKISQRLVSKIDSEPETVTKLSIPVPTRSLLSSNGDKASLGSAGPSTQRGPHVESKPRIVGEKISDSQYRNRYLSDVVLAFLGGMLVVYLAGKYKPVDGTGETQEEQQELTKKDA